MHDLSQVIDSQFDWSDHDWQPPPREDWVIYELHLGTFTDAGTFLSAIPRLDELVELGVTAVELMGRPIEPLKSAMFIGFMQAAGEVSVRP